VKKQGYTLLEVTLFLAISGGLALIAFVGLGPRLRNVRFTDGMRTIQSRVNQELTDSDFGQNDRSTNFVCKPEFVFWGNSRPSQSLKNGTNDNDSGGCVMNGKLVYFTPDKLVVYNILSLQNEYTPPSTNCGTITDEFVRLITCNAPVLLDSGTAVNPPRQEYGYKNGVTYKVPADTAASPRGFGVIRNPINNRSYQFYYTASQPIGRTSAPALGLSEVKVSQVTRSGSNKPACFELDGRNAQLKFNSDGSQPILAFDEGCSY